MTPVGEGRAACVSAGPASAPACACDRPLIPRNCCCTCTQHPHLPACSSAVRAQAAGKNGSPAAAGSASGSGEYDYDLLIIGCGVGGHGAALHAVDCVSSLLLSCVGSGGRKPSRELHQGCWAVLAGAPESCQFAAPGHGLHPVCAFHLGGANLVCARAPLGCLLC